MLRNQNEAKIQNKNKSLMTKWIEPRDRLELQQTQLDYYAEENLLK